MKNIRIALIQSNFIIGDLKGNTNKIISNISKLASKGADLIVFPELAICGYPPEDLLLKPHFIKECGTHLNKIMAFCKDTTVIVGFPDLNKGKLYNSAAIIRNKRLLYTYHKKILPNYGVFDEKRYFAEGKEIPIIQEDNIKWSINICEDIWVRSNNPALNKFHKRIQLLINISASPYHTGKHLEREVNLKKQAKSHKTAIAYCNLTGGQDELVFDGTSLIIDNNGKVIARGKQFEEDVVIADIELNSSKQLHKKTSDIKTIKAPSLKQKTKKAIKSKITPYISPLEEEYKALVLGTRDYVIKNNFKKVILGLSGGIDSCLTALIAIDALGKNNVIALSLPSQFTSKETLKDKKDLARRLGIKLITVPITGIFDKYREILKPHFKNTPWDVTEENIQARIRGNILMAFSNKFGHLVLTTGNKSETSVGYCTLYGDMAGGLAVLKDVPKQMVYKLTKYRNNKSENKLVPNTIFTKPPSAELREGQKDEDSIPPYSVLDPIIEAYVEKDKSLSQIVKQGISKKTAEKVINLIDRNEYKRRQAPPGIKITPRSFGKDRRMPITCKIPK